MTLGRARCLRRLASPRADASSVLLSLLLFILAAYCSAPPSNAQDTPVSPDEIIRISTDLVTVTVVVTDGRGRRVSDLMRDDFSVRDAGRAAEITHFAAGADHVALAFLLDASGSARDIIARQREAAVALLARFGQRSRVAVVHFREQPVIAAPFTTDPDRARAAFDIPILANRRTAIFDAAHAATRAFETSRDRTERRIVVLISDGLDNASTTRPADVIAEANARDVSFYVIHLPLFQPRDGRLAPRRASKGFRELAEKTGGQFFTVGDAQTSLDPRAQLDLAPVFNAIAGDLQSQYVLGYYAAKTTSPDDPTYRRVEVRVASPARRELRVRPLREGYLLRKSNDLER